jgi:transcriptional regulator with XRE-family HTH domain
MTPEEVKRLRESVGMTQAELADYLGLGSRSQICRMEKGAQKVTGPLVRLLQQLGAVQKKTS